MQTWIPVQLGDPLLGETVRTVDDQIVADSPYLGTQGTVIGVRSGSVTVKIGEDWVVFFPNQLERLVQS